MTNTLATLSSTSFRQGTLLPETTMAILTPLLKFIFFQGEGKCRRNFDLNFLLSWVCYLLLTAIAIENPGPTPGKMVDF